MDRMTVAPIRTLDDFVLQIDRFKLPDFANLNKWNSRVVSNLLYYQTNYLLGIVILFTIIAMVNPIGLLLGFLAIATSIAIFLYLKANRNSVEEFQSSHPIATVAAIFAAAYVLMYLSDGVAVFLTATLFPVVLMFIHSSCRMRNLKNKLNDALETTGVKRTPMGIFLDFVHINSDIKME